MVTLELFARTVHGLETTLEGERFAKVAAFILESYEAFVNPPKSSMAIRLMVPSTFALRWLLPRVNALRHELGNCQLQISSGCDDVPSLKAGSADAVIIRDESARDELTSFELFSEILTPMCSPATAKIINESQTLNGQTLLHASKDHFEWSAWFSKNRPSFEQPNTSMTFDTLDVAFSAAEASMGVIIGDPTLAAERIDSGSLVCPFTEKVLSGKN